MPQPKRGDRLNAVIGTRDDGSPLRARDAILDWLRDGFPFDTSVLRANVSTSAMQKWMQQAGAARERQTINPSAKLSPEDRDLVVFAKQVEAAQAEGEARYWELMQSLAKGNLQKTTTIVKVVADTTAPGGYREIERVVKSERTIPDHRSLQWILDHRYGRRLPIDIRVAEVGALDDDDRAETIGDAMEHYLLIRNIDVPADVLKGNGHATDGNGL